jgi:hypothetical protein
VPATTNGRLQADLWLKYPRLQLTRTLVEQCMCGCGGRCGCRHSSYDALEQLEDDVMADLEAYYGSEATRIVPPPPGNCSWPRHNALQARVRAACDIARACGDTMVGCGALRQNGLRNVQCAQARIAINNECYNGGDRTHRQAAREAARAAANCRRRFNDNNRLPRPCRKPKGTRPGFFE